MSRTTRPAENDALARYRSKRNFAATPEPQGVKASNGKALSFVIQKHWASHLHYDFRLELGGVLLSWAVPKGPSFDPKEKRMAIHVEDHPVSYGGFEGSIPPKHYGAGTVIVWDRGTWEPVGDAREGMAQGKLVFRLHGEKLAGLWELVRIAKPGDKQDRWMLFKKRDEWARPAPDYDVISALPDSVVTHPLGLREERERPALAAVQPASQAAKADLARAKKAPLPALLAPQKATLASAPPQGPGWSLEPKWDGYRILARIERGKASLFTRNGHDWTHKMASLAQAVESLGVKGGWLDGEIVMLDEGGAPQFNALQNALDGRHTDDIVYFLFDAPFLNGQDLRQVPLASRRAVLRGLFDGGTHSDRVRFSPDFDAPAEQMLKAACEMKLEGVIAKRVDAPYVSARTDTWLKLKCSQRQEFVVVGYTDRKGAAGEVGSLMLGFHEDGQLVFAGSVGTGWNHPTGTELHAALVPLQTPEPAVDRATAQPGRWSRRQAGEEHWVKPQMVVEVAFAEWTPDRKIRHASFKGVRTDKPAADISREVARPAEGASPNHTPSRKPSRATAGNAIKVSNPERVIDPSTGLKKIDVVRYYESIAPWLLPHLAGRPVSLVRAPEGINGELFFQKHAESRMPGLKLLDPALWPGHTALLAVDSAEGLLSAAQMNVIEFHTWNSTTRHIDQPNRIVFDLDPGEGVPWPTVQEAATLMHAMLDALGLKNWLKTSGGKGLHVVVPLAPKLGPEVVKGFSHAVVLHMARTLPQKFAAKSGGANRVGKVFIDYLRNGHGQTTVAAFSARSRPGLGVSMPVGWEQLPALKSGAQWTITTAREYVSFQQTDPWLGYWRCRQTLAGAMKALGYRPATPATGT